MITMAYSQRKYTDKYQKKVSATPLTQNTSYAVERQQHMLRTTHTDYGTRPSSSMAHRAEPTTSSAYGDYQKRSTAHPFDPQRDTASVTCAKRGWRSSSTMTSTLESRRLVRSITRAGYRTRSPSITSAARPIESLFRSTRRTTRLGCQSSSARAIEPTINQMDDDSDSELESENMKSEEKERNKYLFAQIYRNNTVNFKSNLAGKHTSGEYDLNSIFDVDDFNVPVNENSVSCEDEVSCLQVGTIVKLNKEKGHGFIYSDLPLNFVQKDVYFHINNINNNGSIPIEIGYGSKVNFILDQNKTDFPTARIIFVDDQSQKDLNFIHNSKIKKELIFSTSKRGWQVGTIVTVCLEKQICFVKSNSEVSQSLVNNNVFMHFNRISTFLPLKINDVVEFLSSAKDVEKPRVIKARILHYTDRSYSEVFEVIKKIKASGMTGKIDSSTLIGVISCKALWNCIISALSVKFQPPDIMILIETLRQIIAQGINGNKELLKGFLENISKTNIFLKNGLLYKILLCSDINCVTDAVSKIMSFLLTVIKIHPPASRPLLPHLKLIADYEPDAGIQDWLFKILRVSLDGSADFEASSWKELPLIPTCTELNQTLVDQCGNLIPVRVGAPYLSFTDYMNTYYRLLRVECFFGIKNGIKDLMEKKLDPKDMNVYGNATVIGFDINLHSGFSLVLKFIPLRNKNDWETCSNLMYGNLICISSSNHFNDPVWAIVSNRDVKLFKEGIITVELCTNFNKLSLSEIFLKLFENNGSILFVESPSYFHAFYPIFKALKGFDMNNFPFSEEIVKAITDVAQDNKPTYLNDNTTLNPNPVFPNHSNKVTLTEFIHLLKSSAECVLDDSQKKVLIHALLHKVAIIQGPPGCGKTYIGIKLLQIITSMSSFPEGPVLILTYKNHALDEFSKLLLDIYADDSVVRIGGRSTNPLLENVNLKSLKTRQTLDKGLTNCIADLTAEFDTIKFRLEKIVLEMVDNMVINPQKILKHMSDVQVDNFLAKAYLKIGVGKKISIILKRINFMKKTVKEILLDTDQFKGDEELSFLKNIFFDALKFWLPNKQVLLQYKSFQNLIDIKKYREDLMKKFKFQDKFIDATDAENLNEERKSYHSNHISNVSKKFPTYDTNDSGNLFLHQFPQDFKVDDLFLNVANIWDLQELDRIRFVYQILRKNLDSSSASLEEILETFNALKDKKVELDNASSIDILKGRKFICMTITGAAINIDLIRQICPSIVLVEEAAEILEPNLIATLTNGIQHLIMIGDHKQLRPDVATYELVKTYKFDISLMERLICNGFPFCNLKIQNRMRPEMAELLLDVYPNLESNVMLVSKNMKPKCLSKTMCFWSHDDQEQEDRSFSNKGEADKIISLTLFLLRAGCKSNKISILCAYQGQVNLIRRLLQKEKDIHQDWFCTEDSTEHNVIVSTIDSFQGDENEIIIISTVRSNLNGKIGFLKLRNRICVAQSRAKCAMIFVGNRQTLEKCSHWYNLIHSMSKNGIVGPEIDIQCPKHGIDSKKSVTSALEMKSFAKNPGLLCSLSCNDFLHCKRHRCPKTCFPNHIHSLCNFEVNEIFPGCGHNVAKPCYLDISKMKCTTLVPHLFKCGHAIEKACYIDSSKIICEAEIKFNFENCHHQGLRRCHEMESEILCKERCQKFMNCKKHKCKNECGSIHNHDDCFETVSFVFDSCGHSSKKGCFEKNESILCQFKGNFNFPNCGHSVFKCCSDSFHSYQCKKEVDFTSKCSHVNQKYCFEDEATIYCVQPCIRKRSCGHKCHGICGEHCDSKICNYCEENYKKELKKAESYAEYSDQLRDQHGTYWEYEIKKTGENSVEFLNVEELVMKFTLPMHNWYAEVIKVTKIVNKELELKFQKAKENSFDSFIAQKFHGTSNEGIEGIKKNGFRLPSISGMYGAGVYFATDASKSSQDIYTKGSNKLLLCDVLLGVEKKIYKADKTLDINILKKEKCDSVYAPRGSAVLNDEFVIFNPDQAIPRYIIEYKITDPFKQNTNTIAYQKHNWQANNKLNFKDPLHYKFKIAEAQFLRMQDLNKSLSKVAIKEINFIINTKIEMDFLRKKDDFKRRNISDSEILAFHGTSLSNVESILKNNFSLDKCRREAHGKGIYFSEFPEISMAYGDSLLLCRVLPGNSYDGSGMTWPNYQSKIVAPRQDTGAGAMVIITDSAQIFPCYEIKLECK